MKQMIFCLAVLFFASCANTGNSDDSTGTDTMNAEPANAPIQSTGANTTNNTGMDSNMPADNATMGNNGGTGTSTGNTGNTGSTGNTGANGGSTSDTTRNRAR